jgi:hypothetical protein
MKIILETSRAHLIIYPRFHYYQWVDTSTGGLLVPDGIIHPVVSDSPLTWLIGYIIVHMMMFIVK